MDQNEFGPIRTSRSTPSSGARLISGTIKTGIAALAALAFITAVPGPSSSPVVSSGGHGNVASWQTGCCGYDGASA